MVILQVNPAIIQSDHFVTWFVPTLISAFALVIFAFVGVIFKDIKSSVKAMEQKMDKVLLAIQFLQTGKEVHDEKIAELAKDVTHLKSEVKDIHTRVNVIEKEHFANHNHPKHLATE